MSRHSIVTRHLVSGLLAAAVVLASPLAANAQTPTPAPKKEGITKRIEKMKTSLALSDDQVEKVKAIYEAHKAAVDPIFADKSLTDDQKRAKARVAMQDTRKKIEAILTPDQLAKFKANRKEKKADAKP